MEKGVFQCISIEISPDYNKSFPYVRSLKLSLSLIPADSKNAVDFHIQKCYIIEKEQPPTKWLASQVKFIK